MALGVVAIAVMSFLAANRPPPPSFTAPAPARATEEPAASEPAADEPAPDEAPQEVRVLVVGDGITAVPPPGGAAWPQLVAEDIAGAGGPPLALTVTAVGDTGYVQAPGGATFGRLAQDAGSDFDVVVFFGSRADSAAAPAIQAAAEAAFAAVRDASPDADLLVIGPAWPGVPPPAYIVSNRDAVAAAAATAEASFTDPLAEDWLTAPGSVGPNGIGLTPEGQRFLAARIGPLVDQVLPADG